MSIYIIIKKMGTLEENEIKNYLIKKGYMQETINVALDYIG